MLMLTDIDKTASFIDFSRKRHACLNAAIYKFENMAKVILSF